jgi:hypothetical protein
VKVGVGFVYFFRNISAFLLYFLCFVGLVCRFGGKKTVSGEFLKGQFGVEW